MVILMQAPRSRRIWTAWLVAGGIVALFLLLGPSVKKLFLWHGRDSEFAALERHIRAEEMCRSADAGISEEETSEESVFFISCSGFF